MAMYGSDSAFSTFRLASSVDVGGVFFTVLGKSYDDRKQGYIILNTWQTGYQSQRFVLFFVVFCPKNHTL